jgi:hypothetical protein
VAWEARWNELNTWLIKRWSLVIYTTNQDALQYISFICKCNGNHNQLPLMCTLTLYFNNFESYYIVLLYSLGLLRPEDNEVVISKFSNARTKEIPNLWLPYTRLALERSLRWCRISLCLLTWVDEARAGIVSTKEVVCALAIAPKLVRRVSSSD